MSYIVMKTCDRTSCDTDEIDGGVIHAAGILSLGSHS